MVAATMTPPTPASDQRFSMARAVPPGIPVSIEMQRRPAFSVPNLRAALLMEAAVVFTSWRQGELSACTVPIKVARATAAAARDVFVTLISQQLLPLEVTVELS